MKITISFQEVATIKTSEYQICILDSEHTMVTPNVNSGKLMHIWEDIGRIDLEVFHKLNLHRISQNSHQTILRKLTTTGLV